MRVGVTYDLRSDYLAQGMGEEETAEFDSEITIAAICAALHELGHEPVRIGNVKQLAARLVADERFDCVFNICEGLKGVAREAQVPALLDAFDIPYVFSDPLTLSLCLDKAMTKRVVRDAGIPTPDFAVVESANEAGKVKLTFPVFAKPVAEGSGKGVASTSYIADMATLEDVVSDLIYRFRQPVLVESFLPGREFTVGIIGTGDEAEVLGVLDVALTESADAHGYGFENKERCDEKIVYTPAEDTEARAAARIALAAWRVLRCRDGGRVDIRNDAQGRPSFMEVNPLAGLNPEHSDLVFIANFKGISYRDLIGRIMSSFERRR
ncbi:MAG: D-alanine--D-alanine ligase [Rhizomicrobium sp.]|jgi:D-alanine-D-alanine ligase